jgi:hypothetical protein
MEEIKGHLKRLRTPPQGFSSFFLEPKTLGFFFFDATPSRQAYPFFLSEAKNRRFFSMSYMRENKGHL